MSTAVAPDHVEQARAFSRFFTNHVGALRAGLLDTHWSLTEARVLYQLGQAGTVEVAGLRQSLDIDGGQLSRVLSRLAAGHLVTRGTSGQDGRRQVVALTPAGERAAALLDSRSSAQMHEWLSQLSVPDQERLVQAMATVRELFAPASRSGALSVTLRGPHPGDLGWVVERHGALYAAEYNWDRTFEALVAAIVADFGRSHDPARERAWIAELGGRRVGSVFCVADGEETAKLRLLLVEPDARGHGVGAALVDACLEFARTTGYRRMTLWTNDCLDAARRIYERAGFTLVHSEPHHSFGQDLVGQTWELDL
jgi:DNA-binding MarR family transcriptional regulator/GNAT superfamily N-acetyltransferase